MDDHKPYSTHHVFIAISFRVPFGNLKVWRTGKSQFKTFLTMRVIYKFYENRPLSVATQQITRGHPSAIKHTNCKSTIYRRLSQLSPAFIEDFPIKQLQRSIYIKEKPWKTSMFIGGFPAMFDDQSEATSPFRMSFSRLAASSTDTVSALAMRLRRACGDDAWDVAEESWGYHRGLTLPAYQVDGKSEKTLGNYHLVI